MANFSDRFGPAWPLFIDPQDPTYAGVSAGSIAQALKNYAAAMPQGQPPIAGPQPPQQRLASQQPTIPIQTAQGAPQSPTQQPQTAPNSGAIGQSPYANMALTGGSGMPIGGLPTQSPAPNFNSPQQVNPQQMQLQQLKMANAPHIQRMQQLLANLPPQIRPYIFGMNS